MTTNVHDTDEPTVRFTIEVKLPAELAKAYREAMTGNDDDVLLAAERAMRERITPEMPWGLRELELDYEYSGRERGVRALLEAEAEINDRREALYGPVA